LQSRLQALNVESSSQAIPAGLAVNLVEIITTSLVTLLMLVGWRWHPAAAAAFWLVWTTIEVAFLSSTWLRWVS
jgi:K+ transporter